MVSVEGWGGVVWTQPPEDFFGLREGKSPAIFLRSPLGLREATSEKLSFYKVVGRLVQPLWAFKT